MNVHLSPVTKPAPPRPRRLASFTRVARSLGVIAPALGAALKPPCARYSSSVSHFSFRSEAGAAASAKISVLHQGCEVLGRHRARLGSRLEAAVRAIFLQRQPFLVQIGSRRRRVRED